MIRELEALPGFGIGRSIPVFPFAQPLKHMHSILLLIALSIPSSPQPTALGIGPQAAAGYSSLPLATAAPCMAGLSLALPVVEQPVPTCEELLAQIAQLEAEIATLEAQKAAKAEEHFRAICLYFENDCYASSPETLCEFLSDQIDKTTVKINEIEQQLDAKNGALQALLGLLAVYC